KLDFAFPRALRDGTRFPSGNDSGAKSRGSRELQSRSVIRAESLDFTRSAVPAREQPDAAIGQDAIHVHQQHSNFFSPRGKGWRRFCARLLFCHWMLICRISPFLPSAYAAGFSAALLQSSRQPLCALGFLCVLCVAGFPALPQNL